MGVFSHQMRRPSPSWTRISRRRVVAVAIFVGVSAFASGAMTNHRIVPAAQPPPLVPVRYLPPIDAPVTDPFRPPENPYGPGNRGLEYASVPGDVVAASADGTVLFAGSVGVDSSVTMRHDDGLVTTYSFLRETLVGAGDVIAAGTPVGLADVGFHFGVKRYEVYLDPAVLLAASIGDNELRAILVPVESPGP